MKMTGQTVNNVRRDGGEISVDVNSRGEIISLATKGVSAIGPFFVDEKKLPKLSRDW